MTHHVDELAAHVRRLGNHELNELLLRLPKPCFAALVEVALARPVLPAGVVLRFEPAVADPPRRGSWSTLCRAPQKRHKHQTTAGAVSVDSVVSAARGWSPQ